MKIVLRHTLFLSTLLAGHLTFAATGEEYAAPPTTRRLSAEHREEVAAAGTTTPKIAAAAQWVSNDLPQSHTPDYDDIEKWAGPFITKSMTAEARETVVKAVAKIPPDQRDAVLAAAHSFMTEDMNSPDKVRIIQAVAEMPADQRANFIQAMQLFIPGRFSSGHDVAAVIDAFRGRYVPHIFAYAQQVQQALDRDITQGGLHTNQMLSRVLQLIQNPDAPLVVRNLRVTGQEALTAQRQPIYDFYRSVVNTPLMQAGIEADTSYESVAEHVTAVVEHALKHENITPQQRFRYRTMLAGLTYLTSIRDDFALHGLPTIHQLTTQLHHVLMHQKQPDPITPYIVQHWGALSQHFAEAQGFGTAGEFLASTEGKEFVAKLEVYLQDTTAPKFSTVLKYPQLKWLKGLHERANAVLSEQDKLAPLTEALFTMMRGHVAKGKMLDPKTNHHYACADGVYLGLIRAFQEVPELAKVGAAVPDVANIACAAGGAGGAAAAAAAGH